MRINGMIKKMRKDKIPENIIQQFEKIIIESSSNAEIELKFIKLMDEVFDKKQCFSIWERNGSCDGGGKYGKAFAMAHADKSLAEKLEILKNNNSIEENEDGTYSAERNCHCTTIRAERFTISPTFYGCAAAAGLYNLEVALGVRLRLISYQEAPGSTDNNKPCRYTFEIKK